MTKSGAAPTAIFRAVIQACANLQLERHVEPSAHAKHAQKLSITIALYPVENIPPLQALSRGGGTASFATHGRSFYCRKERPSMRQNPFVNVTGRLCSKAGRPCRLFAVNLQASRHGFATGSAVSTGPRRRWPSVLSFQMKQSTHPEPQPSGKTSASAAGIIRAFLLFVAWAGLVPYILMFMSIVLETWR